MSYNLSQRKQCIMPLTLIFTKVLRRHKDFDGVNTARDIKDTTPTFKLYRSMVNYTRAVLVLDISGSMSSPRIERLGQVS